MSRMLLTNYIEAEVVLENGRRCSYGWSTPVVFGRCFGKGQRWAKEEMSTQKVPGRSKIREITVTVRKTSKPWRRDGVNPR